MKYRIMMLLAALSVVACATASDAEPTIRPLGDPAATTTTTTEPDPWARPADPDAAYFERVLNELQAISTRAYRMIRDHAAVTPEAEALLRASKTGLNLEYELQVAAEVAEDFPEELALEQPPLLSQVEVVELTDTCALLEATITFDGVQTYDREGGRYYNLLFWAEASDLNPTGWMTDQRWTVENAPELSCVEA